MKTFKTTTELAAASLNTGQYIETYGNTANGDGGGARYYIKNSSYLPLTGDVVLTNGNVAKLLFVFEEIGGVASKIDNDSFIDGNNVKEALNKIIVSGSTIEDSTGLVLTTADNNEIIVDLSTLVTDDEALATYSYQVIEGVNNTDPSGSASYKNIIGIRINGVALPPIDFTPMFNNSSATDLIDVTDAGSGIIISSAERIAYDNAVDKVLISGTLTGGDTNLQLTLADASLINIDVAALLGGVDDAKYLGVFANLTALQSAYPTSTLGSTATVTSPNGNVYWWNGSAWADTGTGYLGDMLTSVYDPTSVVGDAFDMDNMIDGATNSSFTNNSLVAYQADNGISLTTNPGDGLVTRSDDVLIYGDGTASSDARIILFDRANSIKGTIEALTTGLELSGDDLNLNFAAGSVTVDKDPTVPLGVATKQYVDNIPVTQIATIDSPYTVTWGEDLEVDCTAGPVIVTLPTAVGNNGRTIYVTKIDSSTNTVTVDGNGSETINGELTQTINNQWTSLTLRSNGTNVGIR